MAAYGDDYKRSDGTWGNWTRYHIERDDKPQDVMEKAIANKQKSPDDLIQYEEGNVVIELRCADTLQTLFTRLCEMRAAAMGITLGNVVPAQPQHPKSEITTRTPKRGLG